jgi:hypothetical protein
MRELLFTSCAECLRVQDRLSTKGLTYTYWSGVEQALNTSANYNSITEFQPEITQIALLQVFSAHLNTAGHYSSVCLYCVVSLQVYNAELCHSRNLCGRLRVWSAEE